MFYSLLYLATLHVINEPYHSLTIIMNLYNFPLSLQLSLYITHIHEEKIAFEIFLHSQKAFLVLLVNFSSIIARFILYYILTPDQNKDLAHSNFLI